MEEKEYRTTYKEFNQLRCLFEKSILSRTTMCEYAHRFCLADREGVACKNNDAHTQCNILIQNLRTNARFALKQTSTDEPLPHAKEMKVQTGGLLGLNTILHATKQPTNIENIFGLIQEAVRKYGNLSALPYDEITRAIVKFESRKRRRTKSHS
ncbi:MAG: hypothetical protein PVG20_08265 [Thioalkalispiraceae bacterium]|jgi:hypothetical protein